MSIIQFIDDDYIVSVKFETGENIDTISHFESTRINSLLSRKIKVKSELRMWDSVRKISVQIKDVN